MKLKKQKNFMSQFLCMLLIVVMALCTTGCSVTKNDEVANNSTVELTGGELGKGATQFSFVVVNVDNTTAEFIIYTDKETVGDALLEVNLIDGEDDIYGLYVKSVNGVTLDYEKDGKYWAFYINDSYAMTGVDSTPIATDEIYSFKAE